MLQRIVVRDGTESTILSGKESQLACYTSCSMEVEYLSFLGILIGKSLVDLAAHSEIFLAFRCS